MRTGELIELFPMKVDLQNMPNRIRELRLNRDIKQYELAERLGITATHLSHIEMGKRELTHRMMKQVARELGVLASQLLPVEDNPANGDAGLAEIIRNYLSASKEGRWSIARVAEGAANFAHQPDITPLDDSNKAKRPSHG